MPRPKKSDAIDGTVPAVNKPYSSTIVAESIIPIKRPRGRPRKHPLVEAVAASAEPAPREAPGLMAVLGSIPPANAAQPAPATAVKRPRGRPRKHPLPAVAITDIMAVVPVAAGADTGRGGVAGKAEMGDPAVIAFKRPRGRPRKVPSSAVPSPSPSSTPPASIRPAVEIMPSPEPIAASQPSPSLAIATLAIGEKAMADNPAIPVDPTRSMIPDNVGKPDPAVPRRARAGRPPNARTSSPLVVEPLGNSPFCPECGTYVRLFKPRRGRTRRVCPRCHPERMIEKRDPRFNLDKTGMPCKDRGKCRPERCVKALECGEMARKGTIRGAGNGTGG